MIGNRKEEGRVCTIQLIVIRKSPTPSESRLTAILNWKKPNSDPGFEPNLPGQNAIALPLVPPPLPRLGWRWLTFKFGYIPLGLCHRVASRGVIAVMQHVQMLPYVASQISWFRSPQSSFNFGLRFARREQKFHRLEVKIILSYNSFLTNVSIQWAYSDACCIH